MAPGKKQKKSKSKKSKKDSPGLSHIASQLVPSVVFAAVPRTPSNLSRTWPKRSPSPLAQAIGEAGNVGRIVLGDLSKRPPAALPDEHAERTREVTASNFNKPGGDFENEVGYESVESIGGKRFDKTTKFYTVTKKGNSSMGREEGEPSPEASEHFYHILDHENGQIVEPVYSTVNKKKKAAAKASNGEEGEQKESLSEDSSDELTDVTSHDESTTAAETSGRRSVSFSDKDEKSQSKHQRKSMKGRSTGNDSPDGPQSQGKKLSIKRKTPDTIQEVTEDVADEDRPPSLPPYLEDESPQPPERSKQKEQKTSLDLGSDGTLPSTPKGSPEQRLMDEQRRALKVVERLGFEGVSEKLDLSDLSQDEDGYMSPDVPKSPVNGHGGHLGFPLSPSPRDTPQNTLTDEQKKALKVVEELGFDGVSEKLGISSLSEDGQSLALPRVPKNSTDFHGRTSFEQEQFGDTLTESSIPVSEARLDETNLSLSQSFAGHEGFQSQEMLQQSLNNQPQPRYHDNEQGGSQRQARKANKVSSFVQMLNDQAKQRGEESPSHRHVPLAWGKLNLSSSLSPTTGQDISRGGIDPALMQRLEEARQANETSFLERQRHLERLVEQQQALYEHQVEQQKIQQQQQQEVVRQQWKLQEQLRALEKVQQEFAENADVSPRSLNAVSESDVQFQKELVRQQQQFLEQQKDQLRQSQAQHAEVLKQQEKLCNQINLLEEQQKQLQSSMHLLSPAGEDLAEIKQQEQQIMNLLNEQRQQESEYKRLHMLQTSSFTHERKALEQHQEMLQQKIREQEAKSRQLEEQLMDMARKHADSEEQLKKKISMEAESPQVGRKERREESEASDVITGGYDNKERRRHPDRASTSREEKNRGKKMTSGHAEGRDRRSGRDELDMRSGNADVSYEEKGRRHEELDYSRSKEQRFKQKRTDSDLSLNADNVEETQARVRRDDYYTERKESHRDKRGNSSSSRRREGGESHLEHIGSSGEGNSPVDRGSSAVVSDRRQTKESELDCLSMGRIELLEAEKAALMELNTSQQEENKALKQLSLSLQKGSGMSSVVLQQQIKELHQEQKVLRNTVHRLNVELSRYHAKYRPVSFEEVEGLALPNKKEAAPWLVNTKFLAPLFLAYDDRLKEKEQMIKTYDEELNAFKARVMEVVKENQQLHMSLNKANPESLDPDEWQQLQEQAKLVVEENALLMEQQEILSRKMKELQRIHGQEVSKLSKRISSQESVHRSLETELKDMRRSHSNLLRKYEALVADEENKISLQEHLKIMDECRRVLEEFKAKTRSEAEDSKTRVQAIHKEKSNLVVKLADSEARIAQLERELDAYQKSLKKSERKFLFLQRKLEHIQERELTAQETLSQVLTVAEKTAAERDNYVEFAKSQKVEQEKAVTKILAGTQNIKGLEEKLQEYRRKASDKVAAVTGRLREREKEINKLRDQHETEVNNLRALVRQKQRQLELVIGENRSVEKELELVWRTAAADNKRMKDTVKQKGAMFDSDSDPNGHLSSEEGEAT